ncbi:MAG: hypothetical protein IJX97_03745 [Clostridia bacterium]|nr:hypothetical protein [Clostridia bacterium]MBQ8720285.1 hypothetical protein [Clostridia bacterium]
MTKKLVLILILLCSALLLASCGDDGVPEGMQLVNDGERDGFYFYAPEEWTVSNIGGIRSAFVSTLDSTSVSLVEAEMPSVTLDEYFTESLKESTLEIKSKSDKGEKVNLGNAEEAYQYTFSYVYGEAEYKFLQVYAKYKGRFFILTYTALLKEKSEGVSYYDTHLEKLVKIMENVKFADKGTPSDDGSEVVDGYKLASDSSLCGFELYVPERYEPLSNGAIVTCEIDGVASLTFSRMTIGGVKFADYWTMRKDELTSLFGEITVISENEQTTIGNLTNALSYEYTYEYDGETYHVYQIYSATSFSGFVFTFTSLEESYQDLIGEIEDVIERVVFK